MGWVENFLLRLTPVGLTTAPVVPSPFARQLRGGPAIQEDFASCVLGGGTPLPAWWLLQAAGVLSPSMTPTVVDPGAPSNSIPCTGLVEERVRE